MESEFDAKVPRILFKHVSRFVDLENYTENYFFFVCLSVYVQNNVTNLCYCILGTHILTHLRVSVMILKYI